MASKSAGADKGPSGKGELQKKAPKHELNKEIRPAQVVEDDLNQIEKEVDELRAKYEMYFMGIEKAEPIIQRNALRSRLRRVKEEPVRNTAIKFRAQAVNARMISLESYWGRVGRSRENGTYFRDVAKVKQLEAKREKQTRTKEAKEALADRPEVTNVDAVAGFGGARTQAAGPGDEEGNAMDSGLLRSPDSEARTPVPKVQKAPVRGGPVARPSASSAQDLTEQKLRGLYETYVTAKKRCNERVDLRFEDMASSLRKQLPNLLNSTGAKEIEFKVVIKKGSAVLKAIPKT